MPTVADSSGPSRAERSRPPVRLGAVIAIAVAAGLVAWFLTRGDNSHRSVGPGNGTKVTAVSASGLHTLAKALRQPILWAGPVSGDTYELTQTNDGRIYVRYLLPGTKAG